MGRNAKAISEAAAVRDDQKLDRGGVGTLLRNEGGLNSLKIVGIEKFELQKQSYRGPKFVESIGVQAHRIQFSPQDLRDVLSSRGGDDDSSGSSGDEDDNGEEEEGGGDGGDDEFYGFDLSGDDSIVKKVAGEELIFTTEEVEKLVGEALGSDFQMIILCDKSYAARFDRISTNLRGGVVIVSYRLAGPVWDDHMKDYLRVNSIVHDVHFGKTDDDFEEDVWCLYC